MKAQVLVNNLKIKHKKAFDRVSAYCRENGVDLEFVFQDINVKGYKVKSSQTQNGQRYLLEGVTKLITKKADKSFDFTIFAFNGDEFSIPTIPTSNTYYATDGVIYINLLVINGAGEEYLYLTLAHEMMHAFKHWLIKNKAIVVEDCMDIWIKDGQVLIYHLNDQPHNPDSNFAEMWKRLKPYLPTPLSQWNLLPELENKASDFLLKAKSMGYDLKITQGYRSPEVQDELYAKGRTVEGDKVTNATGKTSKHCQGKAFDVAFVGKDPYPKDANWKAIGKIGKDIGLTWGGDFKTFTDYPHFEI